ncbi:MAG: hypothetical protein ACJ790_09165 [Myxococcaceae bacterium]
MDDVLRGERNPFSLEDIGPFYKVMRRVHLVMRGGPVRSFRIGLFAWLPIAIAETARLATGHRPDATLLDLSVHVRLLVALPAMLFSLRLANKASRSAIGSLYHGNFCEPALFEPLLDQAKWLRQAWLPEALALTIAVIGGQLALWNVTGPSGLFHAKLVAEGLTFSRLWYAAVALPLFQFVMFRWLWRWAVWGFLLVRLARLPLNPIATHPDRAAGLSIFSRPLSAFAGFAFAASSVVAAAMGTQVIAGTTTVKQHLLELVGLVFLLLAIGVSPLLAFCGHLYTTRRKALREYGDFANEYMRNFHRKWIVDRPKDESALGSSDIQSMNDLGGAFDVINQTRLFPFGMRPVIAVWAGALLPAVPLLATMVSVEDLLKRIVGALLGGFPI